MDCAIRSNNKIDESEGIQKGTKMGSQELAWDGWVVG
jgi:hypothetical protein